MLAWCLAAGVCAAQAPPPAPALPSSLLPAGDPTLAQPTPASAGTFPTNTPLFAGLLFGVTVIVAGLTFFPALALGPIVEQLGL